MAGGAFWAMMRRIVVIAGCIDAAWILIYAWIGSPVLAALNIVSVGIYTTSYVLIRRRRNVAGVALVWFEVLAHAAIGSLLIGWESGFHYFLLLFIPSIVIGSARRVGVALVLVLLLFYLGLDAMCAALGPLTPLPSYALRIAKWLNVGLIFGMFYSMTAFYRATVLSAEQRLLEQATTDPLTGLANRSFFQARAEAEIARSARSKEPLALMLADVDFFKQINDQAGHDAGDKVLVHLASLMKENLRDMDVLARWGGEEFLALLPNTDMAQAAAVAERIRAAIAAASVEHGNKPIGITMSFGIAQVHGAQDLQAATTRADRALYKSKQNGRNQVSCA
jgi:diguanylate cyclase (GGDEF)-like protein